MEWNNLSLDPNNSDAKRQVQQYLHKIRCFEKRDNDNMTWLLGKVDGKTCLDVGAIGHVLEKTEKEEWKHRHIAEQASKAVGLDIVEEYVQILNNRGFDMRVCDATSDEYLGERFDLVILGDVIEHVENPVKLLRFALRHLEKNGEVVVSTPNPYYYDRIRNFKKSRPFVNLDHISWITPTMALKIAHQADCVLKTYIVNTKEQRWFAKLLNPEIFSRNYIYVYTHKPGVS